MVRRYASIILALLLAASVSLWAQGKDSTASGQSAQNGKLGVGEAMSRQVANLNVQSEQDFYLKMIPAHAEAVDASMLIYATTDDATLRHIAERLYKDAYGENEQLKLFYAQHFKKLPAAALPESTIRNLDNITGRQRDRQYAQDMVSLNQQAVGLSNQTLKLGRLSTETKLWAQDMVRDHNNFIKELQDWLGRNKG